MKKCILFALLAFLGSKAFAQMYRTVTYSPASRVDITLGTIIDSRTPVIEDYSIFWLPAAPHQNFELDDFVPKPAPTLGFSFYMSNDESDAFSWGFAGIFSAKKDGWKAKMHDRSNTQFDFDASSIALRLDMGMHADYNVTDKICLSAAATAFLEPRFANKVACEWTDHSFDNTLRNDEFTPNMDLGLALRLSATYTVTDNMYLGLRGLLGFELFRAGANTDESDATYQFGVYEQDESDQVYINMYDTPGRQFGLLFVVGWLLDN